MTDSELCRVQKFTTAGRFIQKWSRPGNPRMLEVYSIAADDFGNVYVGENLGLFKFTNKGAVLARWSSVSDKNSTFFFVSDVAFDSKDNMYVVDRNNYRIQKFDKNGAFLAKWNTRRPGDNVRDTFPCSIAINSKDMVYLTNEKYRRVDVYSSTGTFIKSWPIADEGLTEFYGTGGMVFDKDDNLYIPSYKCIQVYDGNGNILTRLTATEEVADDNMVFGGRDLAFGPDGYLYILSYDRVIVYQKDGTFVRQWQVGAGQFGYPFGITLDSEGHVYVVEYSNYRVSEFDNEGKLITRWGKKGSGDNQFNCAVIVECDHRDNVYVCDSNNSRIMKKPANSGPVPSIDYVSLGTSPNLGFAPGGSNHLPIDVGVSAKAQAELRAYVFNSKGVWVAQIGMTIDKSGNYSFDWDGKATTGNPAGLAAGKLVPSSSGGTKYTIRAFVQNEHGSVWSTVQTLKFYSSSKVKWIGVSSPLISAGQKTTFTYQIAHFSNVEVRILDAKGKIAAKFRSDTVFPGRSISQAWDGKTTEGNTMGLEPGNAVPAGKYTVQIRAGNTIYNAKNKITVY